MGAAGDLGHDAAEVGVHLDLARHHARHDVVAAHHQRGRRLVAAGLDAEHEGRWRRGHDRSLRRGRAVVDAGGESLEALAVVVGLRGRGTTSRSRPRCCRSSAGARRPGRSRTRGTAPGRRGSRPAPRASTTRSRARSRARRDASIRRVPTPLRRAAGCDDDVGDVGLIAVGIGDEPQPGVADELAVAAGDDVVAAAGARPARARSRTRRRDHGVGIRRLLDRHHLARGAGAASAAISTRRSTASLADRAVGARQQSRDDAHGRASRTDQLIWASGGRR